MPAWVQGDAVGGQAESTLVLVALHYPLDQVSIHPRALGGLVIKMQPCMHCVCALHTSLSPFCLAVCDHLPPLLMLSFIPPPLLFFFLPILQRSICGFPFIESAA